MAPTVHAAQGASIASFYYFACVRMGLSHDTSIGLALGLIPPTCWIAHWAIDRIPHYEFVHTGSNEEFEDAMAGDPKNRIKAVGLRSLFAKNQRQELAKEQPDLAFPRPLTIFKKAMLFGVFDIFLSGLLALWLASQFMNERQVALLILWGAAWAVMPDLVLFGPIYQRLIKRDWFWKLDYFHHWVHVRVLAYDWRYLGLAFQVVATLLFIWLALPKTWPTLLFH